MLEAGPWVALFLVLVANGAPVLANRFFPRWLDQPLDGGRYWRGRPLLGPSKTWRGVAASLIATGLAAALVGLPLEAGLASAALAMLGDSTSSFLKRRLGFSASGMAVGLDQVPEALLPTLALAGWLGLDLEEILQVVALFFVLELLLSWLLFHVGIRKRPY